MSISMNGIDLASSAIDSEFRLGVLEKIVEKIAGSSSLTQEDIERMKTQTFEELKKKYPSAGLALK